ncbi:MAG: hypothetical protein DRQ57_17570 [Gammaproteobacteria bacterium]|nr:MAG: hypothetical protein DRQ57_17570 [Gammaproteobacteria bacterium]
MKKHILYQSDDELQAFWIVGKKITKSQCFQKVSNGEAEFSQYLKRHAKTPIYWLIDTKQETYQTTLMPHVLGKEHRELMAHKVKRLFDQTVYTYGIVQGREMQGRRDDRVLFIALKNADVLQPWFNVITRHKVPLVGIYSLPLLTQNLLKYLPQSYYTLLVTYTPQSNQPAGLRQSFFIQQKLQFSRLIPLNISNIQKRTEEILKQIITTQRFLDNAQMLPTSESSEPLSVIILTDTATRQVFNQSLNDESSTLHITILDSLELALKMGYKGKYADLPLPDFDKTLYLHDFVALQLSRSWYSKNHYASAVETRYFFYRKLRQVFYFISTLLLSGAATASAFLLNEAIQLKQKGQATESKIATSQIELKPLREQTSDFPHNILFIRNIVDIGYHIKARHIMPKPAWQKLSQVLNHHPNIFLERLEWGIGNSKGEIFNSTTQTIDNTESREYAEEQKNPSNKLDLSKHFIEGIRLHGKMRPFKGNYPKALRTFNQFVNDLRQHFWVIDTPLKPYNPSQVLQGKRNSQKTNKAPFIVDILIKHNIPH